MNTHDLGIGVILLIFIWSIVVTILIIGNNQPLILKTCITVGAALLSGILVLIPQHTSSQDIHKPSVPKIIDEFFVTRLSTLFLLSISAIGGLGAVVLNISEPVLAKPLQKPT